MPNNSAAHFLNIAPVVQQALQDGHPVVALESTIICHGMPYPKNVETALKVEANIREHGATPATIAILDGQLRVGLSESELEHIGRKGPAVIKASRRDLPFVITRQVDAATTVASTMIIAAMAGIKVFATGGCGGVHRNVEETLDISADLEELARSNVAVVCSGIKSILDIGRSLEYLETRGVPVVGYQSDTVPAFYTRSSGFPVDYRIDAPAEAAVAMKTKWDMGLTGGLLITNPVPEAHALEPKEIDAVIDEALIEMQQRGISGKETTPFLLTRIAERTTGKSLETNIQLVLNNVKVGAEIAVAYARLTA